MRTKLFSSHSCLAFQDEKNKCLARNRDLAARYRQLTNEFLIMKEQLLRDFDHRIKLETTITDIKQVLQLLRELVFVCLHTRVRGREGEQIVILSCSFTIVPAQEPAVQAARCSGGLLQAQRPVPRGRADAPGVHISRQQRAGGSATGGHGRGPASHHSLS